MILRLRHVVTGRLQCQLIKPLPIFRLDSASFNNCRPRSTRPRNLAAKALHTRHQHINYPVPTQRGRRESDKPAWSRVLAGMAILFAGGLAGFSAMYQQKAPYSDRKRFVFYSDAEAAESEGSTMAELELTRAALEALELNPEAAWGEDHPVYGVTRRILDRLLVGHGMDPAHWKLHIMNVPENENMSAMIDGHFVIFAGVFYGFEDEEAVATLMTNALSNNKGNYQAEIQSYRLFKQLSLISAINLLVMSFFAKKLWFVSIPYMAWWASYKLSGEGRCQIMMQEIDHNGLTAMFKAGMNPGWAPITWLAYAQGLLEGAQMLEKDEDARKTLGPAFHPLLENMRENAVGFVERADRMMELMERDPVLKKVVEEDLENAEMTPLPTFVKPLPPGSEDQQLPPSEVSDSLITSDS